MIHDDDDDDEKTIKLSFLTNYHTMSHFIEVSHSAFYSINLNLSTLFSLTNCIYYTSFVYLKFPFFFSCRRIVSLFLRRYNILLGHLFAL